jgi:hypothetical protein
MKTRYYKYNLLLEDCDWTVAGVLLTNKELDRAIKDNRGRSGCFVKAKVKRECIMYSFGYRMLVEDYIIQVPAERRGLMFAGYRYAAAYIREQRSKGESVKEITIYK